MVYVEKKEIRKSFYYYHTKSLRLGVGVKKFRRYIGKDKAAAYSMPELVKSANQFSEKEYSAISAHYNLNRLTYSTKVIKAIVGKNSIVNVVKIFFSEIKDKMDFEFPIIFIYNSNNIEGSRLPLNEVRNIMTGKESKYHNRNEVLEAINSIKAYKYMETGFKFNIKSVKELHTILTYKLKDREGNPYEQGFKERENVVGKQAFETTHPADVKKELKDLLDWYKNNKKNMFPPELAFMFYFKFEKIHPFLDGNGRTGRLLMNKILIDNKFQPMIIYSKNIDSHMNAFAKGRTKSVRLFLDFMFKRYRANFSEFYGDFVTL